MDQGRQTLSHAAGPPKTRSVLPLKKVKRGAVWFEAQSVSNKKSSRHININFINKSNTDKTNKPNTLRLPLEAELPESPILPPVKARWGRDGGIGGKGNPFRAGGDRKAAVGRAC